MQVKIYSKENCVFCVKAKAVLEIFSDVNEPYPNSALTISSEAKIKPMLAGIDIRRDSSIDLL